MFKDTQFIVTLQLALIGIVLVAGLYLVWKALGRIEEKVDLLLLDKQSALLFESDTKPSSSTKYTTDLTSDSLMKSIFPDESAEEEGFVIFSSPLNMPSEQSNNGVEIEEVHQPKDITAESDITVTHIGFSKTKLRTMSIDKLKDLCHERQLSTEGTKNQLIERLLA